MRKDFLKKIITSQAGYVEYGYGQVEPNHLGNQSTKQTYGQLPADADIDVLENGQFAKYDYENGVVNFTGDGEWMLVYNEIKLYRDEQLDCEFALVKDDYAAAVYSPFGGPNKPGTGGQVRDYSKIVKGDDPYEIDYADTANGQPFKIEPKYTEKMMPEGTTMVPRLIKTEVGDIFTTNTIKDATVALGAKLTVGTDGILAVNSSPAAGEMVWKAVKLYTMPDGQKGVKLLRIQ